VTDFVIFMFGCVVTAVSLGVTILLIYGANEDPPE